MIHDLLTLNNLYTLILLTCTIFATWRWRHYGRKYYWLLQAADLANMNYRKYREGLLESNYALQRQLEAAEKKWGEVTTQIEYDRHEMELFMSRFKELEQEKYEAMSKAMGYKEERDHMREQLKDTVLRCLELEQENNILNQPKDPHAFPM